MLQAKKLYFALLQFKSCSQNLCLPRWRRGSGPDCGSDDPGSIPSLTACGPSDGKEVKDVFGRPCARVGLGSAR